MPMRTVRAEIIAGKLKNFHPLVVDVQHPELVMSQTVTGVCDEPAIRRYAGQTIVHSPCAKHLLSTCRRAAGLRQGQTRQVDRALRLGESQLLAAARNGQIMQDSGHQSYRPWLVC